MYFNFLLLTFYFFTPLEIIHHCSAAGLDFRIIPAGFNASMEFLTGFTFLFGLIIGSFLNCLIWRLYKGESMAGRSRCPKCEKQIAWHDNIPVLSFIMLKGKCRHCGKAIDWQYPIVELVTGVLFALAFYNNFSAEGGSAFGGQFSIFTSNFLLFTSFVRDWFIIAVMIVIFVIDLRWYLILDIVALPAAAVVFILNLILGMNWQNLLISGIIGMSFFLIQFLISKGKWIGGGDIRLGLLMGFALGWPNIIVAILLAYFMGSIVGVGLIAAKKKGWKSEVPLGVFLSTATIIALFWGEGIVNWYLNLIN